MPYDLRLEKQKEFIKGLAGSMDRRQLESLLHSFFIKQEGKDKWKSPVIQELIRITNFCDAVPDIYSHYRPLVRDGIFFLLSRISSERLIKLVVHQLLMRENATGEERLIELAGQMPTLHKLGQTIARNRNVDPSLRRWLIRLENGLHGTDITEIYGKIRQELDHCIEKHSIKIDDEILSEASVGVVIPFTSSDSHTGETTSGVLKVLKPRVKEHLAEELIILDELALYFDKNRQHYSLKDFRFIETFRDVKEALQKEVDLLTEQSNLKKAFAFYIGDRYVKIPRLLSFSTRNTTAMELIQGRKITDANISSANKRMCARLLFKALIVDPIFSHDEYSLFHGDPHAGNIYVLEGEEKEEDPQVAFLDWSMAGFLSKKQRIRIVRLIFSVIVKDKESIYNIIEEISKDNLGKETRLSERIRELIHDVVNSIDYANSQIVKVAFLLIDQMAIHGIRFPKNLLLFRKAIFTLEGVLHDLDPAFDMDSYMTKNLGELFIEELPKRWICHYFPLLDSPEHYRTLISNADLGTLVNHLFTESLKRSNDIVLASWRRMWGFL
jgi:ubiquinone biosynthesis protein